MPRLTIPNAINDLRQGKMIILVDDEDRENEGDLYMAAEMTRPEDINFMATHGRGLICLTLSPQIMSSLQIPPMTTRNRSRFGTNFHTSIEAREGITTGISAADRAKTIRVAVANEASPGDLVSPGHIFPLQAQAGGVLVRSGQTEGSVDLCKIAGMKPAGVICEIMNSDGTMARMDELEVFSQQHGIGIVTIADVISHRLQSEQLIEQTRSFEAMPPPLSRSVQATQFKSLVDDTIYTALSFGDAKTSDSGASDSTASTLVRMHRANIRDDLFACEGGTLHRALKRLEAECTANNRHGLLVYISNANDCMSNNTRDGNGGSSGGAISADSATGHVISEQALRDYGLGAQVLRKHGVTHIELITSKQQKYAGLSGYGIHILGYTEP